MNHCRPEGGRVFSLQVCLSTVLYKSRLLCASAWNESSDVCDRVLRRWDEWWGTCSACQSLRFRYFLLCAHWIWSLRPDSSSVRLWRSWLETTGALWRISHLSLYRPTRTVLSSWFWRLYDNACTGGSTAREIHGWPKGPHRINN